MKKYYAFFLSVVLALYMAFTGFECSSAEMTSAKVYYNQKNYDKALESLKREVEKNPKSEEGYFWLGRIYYEKDDFQNMAKAFESCLGTGTKYQKDIDALKKSAWARAFNKGLGYFSKASQAVKDSAAFFFEKSAEAFSTAIALEPDSADTYKNLAYVFFNLRQDEKAIEPLTKMLALEPDKDAYRLLANVYYDKGTRASGDYAKSKDAQDSITAAENFDKAISILEKARTAYPTDPNLAVLLVNNYISAGKAKQASYAFAELVKQDPENKLNRFNYGVILLENKDFPSAAEQFKSAIEIDKDYQNAIYKLAVTYVRWGAALQKAAEDKGVTDPQANEKYLLALPQLETYVQNKSDDAAVWELLGKVYSVLGKTTDAKKAFDKADQLRK